ncbi:LacI family DNA-binding transcriptional regulator [Streptomyces sp. CBMA29]|uniref:LacI family DNA-binding transcriptional regulator n=1 Tax=Streptomyces sp. CBMA29 TaxID=1896314 RepID=UPI0016620129|nr:LacI family DNA-binding transcriptional regulator [Streptomyces sp. CBMA29]MBD0736721.1 transcriptional regulator [Streptomyces sp. CBMA29]
MTITLNDVAQAAGVSRSTASRALSGSPLISATTRAQVERAAQQLGYRVNRMASALRSRQSRLIGLVLTNLINASFHTIAEVVQRRAVAQGYQVLLCITDGDSQRERAVLNTLAEHNIDGVIIVGSSEHAAITNGMLAGGTAVVNVIREPNDSAAPAVLAADRDGAYEATTYLLGLGHRRIGFIGGPQQITSGRDRYSGYSAALRDAGLDVNPALVRRGALEPAFGAEALTELLKAAPAMTALIAANHEAAFGILPTLVAHGVRVPEDLSLICYEDIPWLSWWHPPVTVVDSGPRELGELAMDLLSQQLDRGGQSPRPPAPAPRSARTYRVGAQLIVRSSCQAPAPAPTR